MTKRAPSPGLEKRRPRSSSFYGQRLNFEQQNKGDEEGQKEEEEEEERNSFELFYGAVWRLPILRDVRSTLSCTDFHCCRTAYPGYSAQSAGGDYCPGLRDNAAGAALNALIYSHLNETVADSLQSLAGFRYRLTFDESYESMPFLY